MNARLSAVVALLAASSIAVVPAHAATKKKVIKGTYKVSVSPNPTVEVTGFANEGCDQTVPGGADNHSFTVPAKGTLKVVLQGEDPTKGAAPVGPDWDLFILDPDSSIRTEGGSAGAHEEITDSYKKKQKITIQSCNLLGTPNATVSWTFTYA